MVQIHTKLSEALKRRAQATAALNGMNLQAFVVLSLENTLEAMAREGMPVVAEKTGAGEGA